MCLFPPLIKNLAKMEVKRVEDYLILHGCIDKITMEISSILFTQLNPNFKGYWLQSFLSIFKTMSIYRYSREELRLSVHSCVRSFVLVISLTAEPIIFCFCVYLLVVLQFYAIFTGVGSRCLKRTCSEEAIFKPTLKRIKSLDRNRY